VTLTVTNGPLFGLARRVAHGVVPLVAVIVAVPSATEVTRPADDTVATAASDVVHVTVALAIVAPFWSLTVADSWDVTPSEARLRLVTERVIDVATGVGVGVGEVGVPSPPQLHFLPTTGSEPALTPSKKSGPAEPRAQAAPPHRGRRCHTG
jgi:hypothetical protein